MGTVCWLALTIALPLRFAAHGTAQIMLVAVPAAAMMLLIYCLFSKSLVWIENDRVSVLKIMTHAEYDKEQFKW